jgi:hypothetical protein
VQFNSGGVFGGDAAMLWDNTNKELEFIGTPANSDIQKFTSSTKTYGLGFTTTGNSLRLSTDANMTLQITSLVSGSGQVTVVAADSSYVDLKAQGLSGAGENLIRGAVRNVRVGKVSGADMLFDDTEVNINTDVDMTTHQIHNVVDPSADQDAATKNYVDSKVEFHVFVDKFAALLTQLDNDTGVADVTYAANHNISQAYLWKTQFNNLLTQLDNDTGVADVNYNSLLAISDPLDLKTNYNALLVKLDNDTGVADVTYAANHSL